MSTKRKTTTLLDFAGFSATSKKVKISDDAPKDVAKENEPEEKVGEEKVDAQPKVIPESPEELITSLETYTMDAKWRAILKKEFTSPYFKKLKSFLASVIASKKTIFPPLLNIYAWSVMTPPESVRVIILGQDPYHGPNQAHGLCFSVPNGTRPPPSLVNIYKTLEKDIPGFKKPHHGYLGGWAQQGVLLLNAVLTVESSKPASHANQGWETFTDAVIRYLATSKQHLVFMLWGAYAQKKCSFVDKSKHLVLQARHPSPLSAHQPPSFFDCGHFSKANAYLAQHGFQPIDWSMLALPSEGS